VVDSAAIPPGSTAVVLGAGGAARAVARALGRAGARVVVSARRPDAAEVAARLAPGESVGWDERSAAVAAAGYVVNATPIGMAGRETAAELPVGLEAIHGGQVLADLVYHPRETPLLQGARARGAAVVDGLGMLVHQAALQIEAWTGLDAPVGAMRAAAEQVLGAAPTT
jgi:shikimate dehydrogenase